MTYLTRLIRLLPFAGALVLAACGGGASQPGTQSQQQGIAVGEPSPSALLDTAPFLAAARGEACAGTSNRLFVIDQKFVYWERSGNCPDNAYAKRLFGNALEKLACSQVDSIAGPRLNCADDSVRALFATIVANDDKADLGLGAGHAVVQLKVPAPLASATRYTLLASETVSAIHTPKAVAARDQAAFAALWAEHRGAAPAALPAMLVDFNRQMVVGVFYGDAGACDSVGLRRVALDKGALAIDYENRSIDTGMACIAMVQTPAQFIAVERSDAPIALNKVETQALALRTIERANHSLVATEGQRVVRDAASWSALWREHAGAGSAVPAVDFTKKMVLAVFQGSRPNGCNSIEITGVFHAGGAVRASYAETTPGPATLCIAAVVQSAHLVEVERSDEAVVFTPFDRIL